MSEKIILSSLEKYGLDSQFFELEMTESVLVESSENVLDAFEELRRLGIKISLDDFGTGFSSLNYLSTFSVDSIKIDRSFISKVDKDKNSAIVVAVIQMAHAFGYKVVAEGVETQDQLDFLKQIDCDIVQGYFYSRPIPADAVDELIDSFNTIAS